MNYKIIDLLNRGADLGISVFLEGERLRLEVAKDKTLDPAFVKELKACKAEVIAFLQESNQSASQSATIHPYDRQAVKAIPLSYAQERLWFVDQLHGSLAYHMPIVLRLKGVLNIESVNQAFRTILSRHEVLRTVFEEVNGQVSQVVKSAEDWKVEVIQLATKDQRVEEEIQEELMIPFDLSKDFPVRVKILKTSATEQVLIINIHHIASDGWSMPILIQEFITLYQAIEQEQDPALPALPIQYSDYAVWQRHHLSGEQLTSKLQYWEKQLQGLSLLNIATDFPRPHVQSTEGARLAFSLDQVLSDQIRKLSQKQGATLFMTLLAAFKVLLHRYSGEEDICVGTPVANRNQSEIQSLVGFFANMLALRSSVKSSESFIDLIQNIKATTLDAYEHQDVPFEKIVNRLDQERDLSQSALFQMVFVLHNNKAIKEIQLEGLEVSEEQYEHTTSKFDLVFEVGNIEEDLKIAIEYCTALYTPATIERFFKHYKNILTAIVNHPNRPIGKLSMLSKQEEKQILHLSRHSATEFPRQENIVLLFERQAQQQAEQQALSLNGQTMTYEQLNKQANQLAHYLRKKGAVDESLIGIYLSPSFEMIISILAILKAGGAYVPLDPDYPQDRTQFILEDAQCPLVITTEAFYSPDIHSQATRIIQLDTEAQAIAKESDENPAYKITPDHLAYVIYTSGSTGRPKGVLIEHCNVVRLFFTDQGIYDFDHQDTWTLFHSYCFDFSVWEIFGALLFGGRLVIVPKATAKDTPAFIELLQKEQVTVLNQTPSYFQVVQEIALKAKAELPIRYVIFGGEALSPATLQAWVEHYPNCKMINMYGITETTVHVTFKDIQAEDIRQNVSNIGLPIPTLSCYVLDHNLQLLPPMVPGELYVEGEGLARAYLNRPKLTEERFIPNPYSSRHAKLYKTGDLARWLPSGELEYLGRIDDQIKLNGYRIELGEIEATLQQHPAVQDAIVLLREEKREVKNLVAYLISKQPIQKENIRHFMEDRLPGYMIPAFFISLEQWPLTVNGKINKNLLPAPVPSSTTASPDLLPNRPSEVAVAEIWKDILQLNAVGRNDNFFDIGGDSITIIRVISRLKEYFGKSIEVIQFYKTPILKEVAQYFEQANPLSSERAAQVQKITAQLNDQREKWLAQLPDRAFIEDIYPMSDIQKGMVHESLISTDLPVYHDQIVYQIPLIPEERLHKAMALLVEKHAILRTAFNLNDFQEGMQVVYHSVNWSIERQDISHLDKNAQEAFIQDYAASERKRPFKPAQAPLWRLGTFKVSEQSMVFFLQCHHAILDGWSVASLNTELYNLCQILPEQPDFKPTPLKANNRLHIIESWIDKSNDQLADFWKEELSNYNRLDLFKGDLLSKKLNKTYPQDYLEKLNAAAEQMNISLKALFFGAYLITLKALTPDDDLTVGLVANTRPVVEDGDKILGCFLNTIPFRLNLSTHPATPQWIDFFQLVDAKLNSLRGKDRLPLSDISRITEERSFGENPFFDVLFNFVDFHIYNDLEEGPGSTVPTEEELSLESFDFTNTYLDFTVFVSGNRLNVSYGLRKALKNAYTLEQFDQFLETTLQKVIHSADTPLSITEILPQEMKDQLIDQFNTTEAAYPKDQTFLDLFAKQVALHPMNTALLFEEESWSYQELDQQANQLANHLVNKGLNHETPVAICMDRSPKMLIGLLGILKAGGTYIPLDPNYPKDRIRYIIQEVQASYIISTTEHESLVNTHPQATLILLDQHWQTIQKESKDPLQVKAQANHLAYIIFTSGSTGLPKGVMIEHKALLNFLCSMQDLLGTNPTTRLLAVTTYSFDICYLELYLPLISGGAVVLANHHTASDAYLLKSAIAKYQPTHMQATPITWQFLVDAGWKNTENISILSGGEAIKESLKDSLTALGGEKVWNLYGPTETTIWSSTQQLKSDEKVNIGRPIANTQIYILNTSAYLPSTDLVPLGAIGELCIGGDGLARGYYNKPELTAQKFITNPFAPQPGARLYRTGDWARQLPDGTIECLGRIDDQVKIRGYRIELGEIEALLSQSPQVGQCAVAVKEDLSGTKQLVAYIIPEGGYQKEVVLEHLKQQLPSYMIPSFILELDVFPLTPNGKIDKKELPVPNAKEVTAQRLILPRNETEKILAEIWQDTLQLEQVGVYDNFFELGGHSLLATWVIASIRSSFGTELTVRDLFNSPTIAALAMHIKIKDQSDPLLPPIPPAVRGESIPLSYAQERIWFIDRLQGSLPYHMPLVIRLEGALDFKFLQTAFKEIISRHEILRTIYLEEDGVGFQQVLKSNARPFTIQQINELSSDQLTSFISKEIQQPFNLAEDLLLRVSVIQTAPDQHLLVMVMHHIASDGWSMQVLLSEFIEIYNALQEGRTPYLPTLPIQYADYAIWQRKHLSEEVLTSKLAYWKEQLNEVPPLNIPTDFSRPKTQSIKGASHYHLLDEKTIARIRSLAQEQGTTLFMTLLAAYKVMLYQYSGQTDICVGSPVAYRTHSEVEHLMGFFANTMALRSDLSNRPSFIALLQQVKETTLEAYSHQDVPFEKIVDTVVKKRDLSRSPLFQAMFALQSLASSPENKIDKLQLFTQNFKHETSITDLVFNLTEIEGEVAITVEYCTDLFLPDTIKNMMVHFENLLRSIVDQPQKEIGQLSMLSIEEKQQLLRFSQNKVNYPKDQTIVDLFEEQVMLNKNKPAIVFEHQSLSYQELNEQANQLAHWLQSKGVKKEMLVGICMDRSIEMMVALMGILKAGAAYVPIDAQYPAARIQYLLEDTAIKIILCDKNTQKLFSPIKGLTALALDDAPKQISEQSKATPERNLKPEHLMYVLYTSGSTGQPKGVMNQHSGVVNRLLWAQDQFKLDPEQDTLLQKTTYSFDVSVWELFWPLITGVRLAIAPPDAHKDAQLLKACIDQHQVSHIHFVPSMLDNFLAEVSPTDCQSLRHVLCSGEALKPSHAIKLRKKWSQVRLHNLYGPTEAAIDVTYQEIPANLKETDKVPIGRPVANTPLYILNSSGALAPAGTAGELHISGIQVARGYLNREQLTAEKFIPDPFSSQPNAVMYKTGDLARWQKDGTLEYLGRIDHQVKIRGQRIELGEIEVALQSCKEVEQAVVMAKSWKGSSEQELVAYYVPGRLEGSIIRKMIAHKKKGLPQNIHLYTLPDGVSMYARNKNELLFLHKEIITENSYLKHGITLGQNACVLDVGANLGVFSTYLALANKDIKVYAFEPLPPTFEVLQLNTHLYGGQVEIFNYGLSSQEETATFTHFPYATILSSRYSQEGEVENTVRQFINNAANNIELEQKDLDELLQERLSTQQYDCQLRTLSSFIQEQKIEQIDLLKIDVEKSELDVLKGIEKADWKKIKQLVLEVHDDETGRLEVVKQLLQENGFEIHIEQSADLKNTQLFDIYAKAKDQVIEPAIEVLNVAHDVHCNVDSFRRLIKSQLKERLPDYMIPSLMIELEEIPLSLNGKIDRKALPAPDESGYARQEYIAPETALEKQLATIWEEILQVNQIGLSDDFFDLGGHSLLATRVVALIRKRLDIELAIKDLFLNPTIASLVDHSQNHTQLSILPSIRIEEKPQQIPLSYAQERLWFIHRFQGSENYHIPITLQLAGQLDHQKFEQAIRSVIKRHQVLRTVYRQDKYGNVYQEVLPINKWQFSSPQDIQASGTSFLTIPFKLDEDYMVRAQVIKESPRQYQITFVIHHIAIDGWSVAIFIKELIQAYQQLNNGQELSSELAPLQYADYAIWQKRHLKGEKLEEKLAYWNHQLKGFTPLNLPTDYPRPSLQSPRGASHTLELSSGLNQQIQQLSKQKGVTAFMTFIAVFKLLLHRYSGQDDICIGTPIANRTQQETEKLIGFFVNTLVIRSQLGNQPTFHEFLQQIKETTINAYSHQEVPFEKIVDHLEVKRDKSRSPIFQVLFSFEQTDTKNPDHFELEDLQIAIETPPQQTSKFDLSFTVVMSKDTLQVTAEYCTDLFAPETIERMLKHYENLLQMVIQQPASKIGELQMSSSEEEQLLQQAFIKTASSYSTQETILDLLAAQVLKTPEQDALVYQDLRLTYRELDERSNQLAHYLIQKGIKQEQLVAICINRSPEMIIAILGVLKAGGAYVPIDPEYPEERILYMLEDSNAPLLISNRQSSKLLSIKDNLSLVLMDADQKEIAQQPLHRPKIDLQQDHLAYVIYTSGSTGKPKGVMIEHKNLYGFVQWSLEEFKDSSFDIVYNITSICFDLSIFEIFYTFSCGKLLRIFDQSLDFRNHLKVDHAILLNTVPSVISSLLEEQADLSQVTVINMAGEPIPLAVKQQLKKLPVELRNLYGPSEDTTYSTFYRIDKAEKQIIGRPVSNTRVHILDAYGKLTPIGVAGELYLSGDGLARGYLNRPELTAEKFIFNKDGVRLYKTGDLARWLPDYEIEYLGRKDDQIKLRGYRIELDEIKTILEQSPNIQQAVVLVREDLLKTKRLIAYIIPQGDYNPATTRQYLQAKLPGFMIPALFVALESFPLTPNGKINKNKLPQPDASQLVSSQYVAASNEMEKQLVEIWKSILQVEKIGIKDNFFELGGNSLLLTRVIAEIKRNFDIEPELHILFEFNHIEALAEYIQIQKNNLLDSNVSYQEIEL